MQLSSALILYVDLIVGREDGRIVVDDIDWAAVAERVASKSYAQCQDKWCAEIFEALARNSHKMHPQQLVCMREEGFKLLATAICICTCF